MPRFSIFSIENLIHIYIKLVFITGGKKIFQQFHFIEKNIEILSFQLDLSIMYVRMNIRVHYMYVQLLALPPFHPLHKIDRKKLSLNIFTCQFHVVFFVRQPFLLI